MRDAFGGAFMIRLFLIFIFIYMFFTAIALNYAKAFKVKNKVIDYLQDNEISSIKEMHAAEFQRMSDHFENEILGTLNYRISKEDMRCNSVAVYCDNGIQIYEFSPSIGEISSATSDALKVYYRVETYFAWNIPFLKQLMSLGNDGNTASGVWTISGETRAIIKK